MELNRALLEKSQRLKQGNMYEKNNYVFLYLVFNARI